MALRPPQTLGRNLGATPPDVLTQITGLGGLHSLVPQAALRTVSVQIPGASKAEVDLYDGPATVPATGRSSRGRLTLDDGEDEERPRDSSDGFTPDEYHQHVVEGAAFEAVT